MSQLIYDGVAVAEGSEISNLTIAAGSDFPEYPSLGELFYLTTGEVGVYVHNGIAWNRMTITSDVASSDASLITNNPEPSIPGSMSIEELSPGILKANLGDVVGLSSGPVVLDYADEIIGTLRIECLPGLIGDATSPSGSNVLTLKNVATAGTYRSVTVNTKGLVTSGTNPTTVDGYGLTDAVKKTGDTMSGPLLLSADPTVDAQAATKSYVDAVAAGLSSKHSVRAASTGIVTLSGPRTVDGVAVVVGDRVLIKNQTIKSENGIYVVQAGAWTRPPDAITGKLTAGSYVFVTEGALQEDTGWVLSTDGAITVGTTPIDFVQFNALGQVIPGVGLAKDGNEIRGVSKNTAHITVDVAGFDLANSGVVPGTYDRFTVDAKGRVTTAQDTTGGTVIAPAIYGGTGFGSYVVGEMLYAATTTSLGKVVPNATATKQFLSQTSSGAPTWTALASADIPVSMDGKQFTGASVWNGNVIQVAYGGTNISTLAGAGNRVLGVNAAGTAYETKAILGTTNRVTVTHGVNSITLSTPQDIATSSSPSFDNVAATGVAGDRAIYLNSATKRITASNATTQHLEWLSNVLTLSRSLPASANGTVALGTCTSPTASFSFLINVLAHDGSTGVDFVATYFLPVTQGVTLPSVWKKCVPVSVSKGAFNLDLEILVNGSLAIRLANPLGRSSVTAVVEIVNTGWSEGTVFSQSTITSTSTATEYYDPSVKTLSTGTLMGVLPVQNGGTGLGTVNVGDILYSSASNTLSTLAAAAAGNVLLSGPVPSWGKVSLSSSVAGTLGIGNGGTGITSVASQGNKTLGVNAAGTAYEMKSTLPGNSITVTHGVGSITIDTIQDIRNTASPTFSVLNATSGIISGGNITRTTAAGNTCFGAQDSQGRSTWYWNTTGGASPTLGVANEHAVAVSIDGAVTGQPSFEIKTFDGAGKAAGAAITWTNLFVADPTVLKYKTYDVYHTGNLTNVSQLTNNSGYLTAATALATVTGDVTGSGAIGSLVLNLTDVVAAGTYRSVTVNAKGRVTAGTNPTTISGYGITDAYTKTETNTLLAGKANNATTLAGYGITDASLSTHVHTFASLTTKPTTLAGYGITDASVVNPTTAKDGDVRVVGSVISIYAGGAWRQIYPAVYQ